MKKIAGLASVLAAGLFMLIFGAACGAGEAAREGLITPASSVAREDVGASAAPSQVESGPGAGSTDALPGQGSLAEPAPEGDDPLGTFTLTVPEHFTLARIGMLLEEKGVCTTQQFIDAAQNGDYSEFPLIAAQEPDPNRCFTLEGYLFPDTYEFYQGVTPEEIICTMLANTEKRLAPLQEEIAASGYTAGEILTLASIIEKEAFGAEVMPKISSVLHNRLDAGWRIECDVTIKYVEGAIKPFISGDENRYNEYYNTYKCPALPAGPICNPGMAAIQAALRPEQSDYFFFLTDADANYYFAVTLEEHNANKAAVGIE